MNEKLRTDFLYWWQFNNVSTDNPYSKDTPQYWAWEGFRVGVKAEREECAELILRRGGNQLSDFAVAIKEKGFATAIIERVER